MENNIPLRNINRDLNFEERQETANPRPARNNNWLRNRNEDNAVACGFITSAIIFVIGFAYFLGKQACESKKT